MKRTLFVFPLMTALLVLGSGVGVAAVLNVEFKFTPFTGDLKSAQVDNVPGLARVFINNVPHAEVTVRKGTQVVLFDAREVSPVVWVPMQSAGPAVRNGRNKIRIEFTPTDPNVAYQTQVSWATVNDSATSSGGPGTFSATNQSDTGVENKTAKGKMVFEREFTADFAADLPWHHYAAATSLSDEDRQKISAALTDRLGLFKANFAAAYKMIGEAGMKAEEARKLQCLEKAYAAGIRIAVAPATDLDYLITGNPEVVVRRKSDGQLFQLDSKLLERIKGEDSQFCAEMALSVMYPPKLVFVRTPAGEWQAVY